MENYDDAQYSSCSKRLFHTSDRQTGISQEAAKEAEAGLREKCLLSAPSVPSCSEMPFPAVRNADTARSFYKRQQRKQGPDSERKPLISFGPRKHESTYTIHKLQFMEVDQKAERNIEQLHVAQQLRLVDR